MSVKRRYIKVDIDDALHLTVMLSYGRNATDDCVGFIVVEGRVSQIFTKTSLGTRMSGVSPDVPIFAASKYENWWKQVWLYLQSWYNDRETVTKVATGDYRDA